MEGAPMFTLPADGREDDPFGEEYFRLRDELVAAGVAVCRPLPDWSEGAGA
jgi:hypothetical protein